MSTQALSRANRETILRCLRLHGQLERADIARHTGLSTATVSRLVGSLMDANLIVRAGSSSMTGGRPSLVVRFNDAAAVTLAADVADRHTEIALIDLGASVLYKERHLVADDVTPDDRIQETLQLLDKGYQHALELGFRCVAIGVSVPGPVDDDGLVEFAPALGWHRVPLGAMLEQRFPLPVVVENDANLIAVAEHRHGVAQGASSLVSIAVFEGIGSGIIANGQLWRGGSGAAGQLGRMLLSTEALQRVYSGFGDLETSLGSIGIARRAAAAGLAHGGYRPVLETILSLHNEGDPTATAFLDEVFDEFAMSIVNVCAIVDPEVVVFAGLFAEWSDIVIPSIRRRVVGHVLHMPMLVAASSHLASTLVGAADVAFDRFGSVANLL